MPNFYASVRVNDGIVIVTDSENEENRQTATIRINDNTIAIIVFNLQTSLDFCNRFLQSYIEERNSEKIIKETAENLAKYYAESNERRFSIVLASFSKSKLPFYFAFWIDNTGIHAEELLSVSIFSSAHQDLGQYLVMKVFSKHMTLEEATNLTSYVTQQCYDTTFSTGLLEMTILSHNNTQKFTDDEFRKKFQLSEKIDQNLKKIFSDFFVAGANR